jgi:hypothetical protein
MMKILSMEYWDFIQGSTDGKTYVFLTIDCMNSRGTCLDIIVDRWNTSVTTCVRLEFT